MQADACVAKPSLAKLALRVYWFPGYMLLIGVIPLVNAFAYSLHGGLGWFALPFTLPFVLVRLGMAYCVAMTHFAVACCDLPLSLFQSTP